MRSAVSMMSCSSMFLPNVFHEFQPMGGLVTVILHNLFVFYSAVSRSCPGSRTDKFYHYPARMSTGETKEKKKAAEKP